MSERRLVCVVAGWVVGLGMLLALSGPAMADAPAVYVIVPYEPTPPPVVEVMLKLAKVGPDDVVYDLGCGDGRIIVMAVKKFGAKLGIGVDLDPERIKESKEEAKNAGVEDRIKLIQANMFDQSLKEPSVITAYLLPNVNLMVRPMLYRDLKPGSRVVTHAFHMADWEQDALARHKKARNNTCYLYIIPASVGGTWDWTMKDAPGSATFYQEFQFFRGDVKLGSETGRVSEQTLKGTEIQFNVTAKVDGKDKVIASYSGTVDGNTIKGRQDVGGAKQEWTATRKPFDVVGNWAITVDPAAKKLDGVLSIEKKSDGTLSATYTFNADKKPITPQGIFVWGPCVRWEVPVGELGGPTVDFKGVLLEGSAKGVATSEGWSSEPTWVAKKEGK